MQEIKKKEKLIAIGGAEDKAIEVENFAIQFII